MEISHLDFFIGMGLGIAGAFGTGFLKKAGEEFYSSIKERINPKSPTTVTPPVVVHVLDNRGDAKTALTAQSAPALPERLSEVTFDEIEKAYANAPPMQREQIANGYVGLKVEWDTYLKSAVKIANGRVLLRLSIDRDFRLRSVTCKVKQEEYRVLAVSHEGTHIRIAGEVADVTYAEVELSNVRLQIFNSP